MMRFFILTTLSVLLLNACHRSSSADPSCTPLAELQPIANPVSRTQVSENFNRCLKRSAYKLGRSQGSNSEIAEASIKACGEERVELRETYRVSPSDRINGDASFDPVEAFDNIETPQSAKQWVIEGRAGRCFLLMDEQK